MTPRGTTLGSIEGDANIFLGARMLTFGGNGRNTVYSGLIKDGAFGHGGSLAKIGQCRVVLSNANTYTGGTSIQGGALLINNLAGSGTGSGPVQVTAGRLGGTGTIAGAVTLGTGTGPGAVLSPGYANKVNPGSLTVQNAVTFKSDATYNLEVNSNMVTADRVTANGVVINAGAQLSITDLATGTLSPGTTFTAIDTTATTRTSGTFANLPAAGTVTVGSNSFQANYEGGDGNDLTLTVVGN